VRLYLAALYTSGFNRKGSSYRRISDKERLDRDSVPHVLESFHYTRKGRITQHIRDDGLKVFLDSGAFSDFTQGHNTSLESYAAYIHKNADVIEVASVLDGIGDPKKTLDNQVALEAMDCDVLPCFHYGEPLHYLKHYMENYEYITLGGMVPISTKDLRVWLDDIFGNYLTDHRGQARLKVHGFGLTTMSLVERYPWYSVDSSSWVQTARTGGIHLPTIGAIQVSAQSPSRKELGRHYLSMNAYEQSVVDGLLAERGYTAEQLSGHFSHRFSFNCLTYTEENTRLNAMDLSFEKEQELLF
jgi:hypothetical protein